MADTERELYLASVPARQQSHNAWRVWQLARRVTPPSTSTAPEELKRLQLNHGLLEVSFEQVKARAQQADARILELEAAIASRPAEVDDEGLPALPTAFVRIDMDDGSIWGQIQDEYWENEQQISLGIDDPLFTAEQYRQGQRDAVAADRARREDGWISVEDRLPAKDVDVLVYLPNNGDPLIEMDAWGEIYECPVSFQQPFNLCRRRLG